MPFPHRINSDGTIDSICDQCFVTVGTSTAESDLKRSEAAHTCEPARVAYYLGKRPPTQDRANHSVQQMNTANMRRTSPHR